MLTALSAALAALVFAALHAIRGAGHQWLRYVMGALAAGATLALAPSDLIGAVATGAGLLVFLLQQWGRWYMLGAGDRSWAGPPDRYEAAIERIAGRVFPDRSGQGDALAWLISATLFALPLAALASPWWLILPPAMIGLYWLALARVGIGPHVRWGEIGTGAAMGLMVVMLAGCAQPSRDHWSDISRGVRHVTQQR